MAEFVKTSDQSLVYIILANLTGITNAARGVGSRVVGVAAVPPNI
jgi:hypothetical protein